jgi:hypothetical protein
MARQMIDIALDEQEDVAISSGDFVFTESTAQHQRQLILNNKGDFKQNPTSCVGAFDYLHDEDYQALIRAMSIEFSKDGMDVKRVLIGANGVVNSDAFYK